MSYTFHKENEAWVEQSEGAPEGAEAARSSEDGYVGDPATIADPTAQTGTLDTSGTTGTNQTAEDVSAVFDVADEASAERQDSEGEANAPFADPAEDLSESEQSIAAAAEEGPESVQGTGANTSAATGTDADADGAAGEPKGDAKEEDGDEAFSAKSDPADYTVTEVNDFLANASAADKKKVLAAEKKGKGRKGILDAN